MRIAFRDRFRSVFDRVLDRFRFGERAPQGEVYRYSTSMDNSRTYKTDSMTFVKLARLLKSGESGVAADLMQLADETEVRDAHLAAVANTRRLGVTSMEWEIEPMTGEGMARIDKGAATEAADYCRSVLHGMPDFELLLEHMSEATLPNLSVAEINWEGFEPRGFRGVPAWRLNIDYSQSQDVRVMTDADRVGVVATPGKFIIHTPRPNCGYPFLKTPIRSAAVLSVIKSGTIEDWATFAEVFGMPMRLGKWSTGASQADRQELLSALASMGSDFYGAFPDTCGVEFIEAGRGPGSHPYAELTEYCDKQQSILLLGQNLTTDVTGGSFAAAEVHDNVRRDLIEYDVRAEARTVRAQLLAPMVLYKFTNYALPVPKFRRVFREQKDRQIEANVLSVAVNDLGLKIDRSFVYDSLGIDEPRWNADGDPVGHMVPGRPMPSAPAFSDPAGFSRRVVDRATVRLTGDGNGKA